MPCQTPQHNPHPIRKITAHTLPTPRISQRSGGKMRSLVTRLRTKPSSTSAIPVAMIDMANDARPAIGNKYGMIEWIEQDERDECDKNLEHRILALLPLKPVLLTQSWYRPRPAHGCDDIRTQSRSGPEKPLAARIRCSTVLSHSSRSSCSDPFRSFRIYCRLPPSVVLPYRSSRPGLRWYCLAWCEAWSPRAHFPRTAGNSGGRQRVCGDCVWVGVMLRGLAGASF